MEEIIDARVFARYGIHLRPFQLAATKCLMNGRDVFVAVPTGMGKTFCYSFLAFLCQEINNNPDPLVIVISPLLALMQDQVTQLLKMGIPATHLDGKGALDVRQYLVAFISPELAVNKLRGLLRRERSRLVGLIVDEAHCIPEWGVDFRQDFYKIGGLRAIIPDTPLAALTATATTTIQSRIISSLNMTNTTTLHILPDRPNIMYNVVDLAGDFRSHLRSVLDPMVEMLNDPSVECPKTLIYCSTIDTVSSVYGYFHAHVSNPDTPPGTPKSPVAMFHRKTADTNKAHVLSEFPKSTSVVRVVICSVAFGLGVNIPDVHRVINFGVPLSLEDFFQESGRAGRDGEGATSTLYHIPSLRRPGTSEAMLKYCRRDIECRRKYLAQHFRLTDYVEYTAPEIRSTPQCCDLCNPA